MSNFTSSNRILKSAQVAFDKANAVTIRHGVYPPQPLNVPDIDEFDFFRNPGNVYENNIREESNEISNKELAEKIVDRAKEEAATIIKAAREDAEIILDSMEDDAKERIRRTEEDARRKGYEEGYAKGEGETEAIKEEARAISENAVQERQKSFDAFEADILNLIVDVLDKLLAGALNMNPQLILYIIRKGFAESNLSGDVIIRVSEDDYEEAYSNREAFLQYVESGAKLEVTKDFSLSKADCVIETPFGVIDCSLDQQYEALKKNLYFIYDNRK